MKPPQLRQQADADLVEATKHYVTAGDASLAERMFDAAIEALNTLEHMPGIGSPQLCQLCEIPGLWSWRVTGFPMQWMTFEAADHLDIVRMLGDRQDILAILSKNK